jgi:hypothetical protein
VRFDRPVDHIHSTLDILRDGKLVERLQPRLKSAPEVLFARAPTLPAGSRCRARCPTSSRRDHTPFL